MFFIVICDHNLSLPNSGHTVHATSHLLALHNHRNSSAPVHTCHQQSKLPLPRPVFYSRSIDNTKLPFVGEVPRAARRLDQHVCHDSVFTKYQLLCSSRSSLSASFPLSASASKCGQSTTESMVVTARRFHHQIVLLFIDGTRKERNLVCHVLYFTFCVVHLPGTNLNSKLYQVSVHDIVREVLCAQMSAGFLACGILNPEMLDV